ncbi:MAG: hypothetical protein IJR59_04135 [Firmicutes bacterium]|nr:hypothetical protein [Bacillota bacterium]
MKSKIIAGIEIFAVTAAMLTAVTAFGAAGTQDDPLVSKSYVDDKINQVLEIVNGGSVSTDGSIAPSGTSYQPVYVSVGQTIIGGEGTELILRSGKGNIYIEGVDGLVDSTTGKNLTTGDVATANHLMIVPRDDGRGVKVTEAAWFLVKGDYTIQ